MTLPPSHAALLLLCLCLCLCKLAGPPALAAEAPLPKPEPLEPGFRRLFDGKTLAGWEGKADVFRVADGAIVAGSLSKPIPNNEFLATTEEFGDFELRLQARLRGQGRNAGVQFRSRRMPNHHEVIGYQCDMGQMKERNIWGWLYDESRRRKFLSEAPATALEGKFQLDGWNDLRILCEGPRVRIWVNDALTTDYREQDEQIASRGIIALQIHGGPPAEVAYRNIRIRVAKPKAD